MRTLALTVTINDCRVDTFRAGGKGGQAQNKRDTGVRVVHEPSGAVGESREMRGQLENKQRAFRRMADSVKFRIWMNQQLAKETPEQWVEKQMAPAKIKTEVRVNGVWTQECDPTGSDG